MAFAAAEAYVQSAAFSARIRPMLIAPLREILGPDAQIGRIKATFLPPSLEVRDIVIPDPAGRPAITVRKIKVYLDPVPLLFKQIHLPAIVVLEPRIIAVRAPDGTVNIASLLERIRERIAAAASSGGGSGFSILVRTFTVRKGDLRFRDAGSSLEIAATGVEASATITPAGARTAFTLRTATIRYSSPASPALSGILSASGVFERDRLRMDRLTLAVRDTELSLSGSAGPFPDGQLDLNGRFRSGPQTIGMFTRFLDRSYGRHQAHVEAIVSLTGSLADPRVAGKCSASDLPLGFLTVKDATLAFRYGGRMLEMSGRGRLGKGRSDATVDKIEAQIGYRDGGLDVHRLAMQAGDLRAFLGGRISPDTGFSLTASALSSGAGRTLSFLTGLSLSGAVGVAGTLRGPIGNPRFEGTLAGGPLTVRKVSFTEVRGGIAWQDGSLRLDDVAIRRDDSRYRFDGSIAFGAAEPVITARLQVLQSDVVSIVSLFYKPIPLALSAKGMLDFHGTLQKYSGNGYLVLDAGKAYGESFTRGTISAVLTTGKISFPQVVLHKKQGMLKATGWIGFDGTYAADLEARDIDLAAMDLLAGTDLGGTGACAIRSGGSFSDATVDVSLTVDALALRKVPLGGLQATAKIAKGRLTLDAGLAQENAHLAASWTLRAPYPWQVDAKLRTESLNLAGLIDENRAFTDQVGLIADATVSAEGEGLDPSTISGAAVFHRLGLVFGEYRIENEQTAFFAIRGGKVSLSPVQFDGPATRIGISGSVNTASRIDVEIHGTANLSLLQLLFQDVELGGGTADVQLSLTKDWHHPDISGELQIQNGEVKIRGVPQRFSDLRGKIVIAEGRIVTDSFSGSIGGGTMLVSGWVQLAGPDAGEFSVKTAVDAVTARYPEGLTTTLSGNLYFDGDLKEQILSGDFSILRARYDKRIDWKSMLVEFGRGLYQKKKTEIGRLGETQLNIRFHGTDNIIIQNNLASLSLGADMFLRGTINRPQLFGRVEARKGSVYFRKNDFTILRASADFIDPNRINPVLDIQAETQVREYQIQLAVTGTAEQSVVSFVSDPPLNDTDILSLLALGKKSSELVGNETNVGVSEAVSFATGQFQDYFEQRARSLTGLDRFQIDPYIGKSDTSVPRITVGKELVQNKLYVTYSSNVGASAPEQVFRIEYILNRHFSLVGERNDIGNTGADIKYRFEFD